MAVLGSGMSARSCSPAQDVPVPPQEGGAGSSDLSGGSGISDTNLDWTVHLGDTGLAVPILAMGTGTVGWGGSSNQTRLGMERFRVIARRAYERGVRFYDMAEAYGSHPFVAESIKDLPRGELTLLTKLVSAYNLTESATRRKIDTFCGELGTDYLDIVLMHYVTSGGWEQDYVAAMQGLSRAKAEGRVRAVGLSCHSLDALREAAVSPWVDVVLARINPFQSHMDGTPEAVNEVLGLARRNGKGVIGMKIFGEGSRVEEAERERSLRFALTEANIHCMTIGFETPEQLDDAVARIMRIKGGTDDGEE